MRRRGFFSALIAGAITPLVVAKPTEERAVRFLTPWEKQIAGSEMRDLMIRAAHVRTGIIVAGEAIPAYELHHWRQHIFLCKDFDDLTAQVASAYGALWPPWPALIPQYHLTGDWPNFQVWPIPDGQYTFTVTTSDSLPITNVRSALEVSVP